MGYLSEFICLIENLRACAEKHRDYLANNEAATRACLVDPVLRVLGWDVSDPEQVQVEFKVEGKAVDYALLGGGKPLVLVEAKSLGAKLKDDFWQLAVYAAKTGASSGVMANGDEWVFLDPNNPSSPQKAKLHLLTDDARKCALLVLQHLDAAFPEAKPVPPPPGITLLSLPELEREISKLGKNVPAPKLKSVVVGDDAPRIPIASYTSIVQEIAKKHADRIASKLPVAQSDRSRQFIAARTPQHGTSASFRAARKVLGPSGDEFYINLGGNAIRLIRWAVRRLTVIGEGPDKVLVELA